MTFEQSLDAFYEQYGPRTAIVSLIPFHRKMDFMRAQFSLYATWLRETTDAPKKK